MLMPAAYIRCSQSREAVKYGHEYRDALSQKLLRWRDPAAIYPSFLSDGM